jgi:hypothetical protein
MIHKVPEPLQGRKHVPFDKPTPGVFRLVGSGVVTGAADDDPSA